MERLSLIVVCLCPSDEIEDFTRQIVQLPEDTVRPTEVNTRLDFIESNVRSAKLLLIVAQVFAGEFLSHRETLLPVDSIFIYCSQGGKLKLIHDDQLNIGGIYERITEQIELLEQQSYQWTVFDQIDYANKDLAKQAHDFLWLQLFHQVMGQWPRNEHARGQFVQFLRSSNDGYQSTDAIQVYLNNSFLGRTVAKALVGQDTDQLYTLRYFSSI